jgi:hypothetical protein
VEAACGGASAKAEIEVFSHIRKSSYRTIHWGGPSGKAMVGEGEDGMGFNLMLGGVDEPSIRERMDIMACCAMGGMHQHDGNIECDWSDPYVYLGAVQRGMDRALSFRTMPNAIGAHLHDEPGLTYAKHPHTGQFSPHDLVPQRAAWKRANGQEAVWFDEVDTKDPAQLAKWSQVNDFKMSYMDAFWKAAGDSMERIRPGYLAVTQTQYGVWAMYDGYYFNVARSLPVISGHGGYNDYWGRCFNPSFFLEFSLPRQLDKPTWYLPEWFDFSSEQGRLEHYLSFITGIQGLSAPPGLSAKSKGAPGIVEANKVMARLGTIFARPAFTRADLAVLYSKSDAYYRKAPKQSACLLEAYLATRMLQQPITVVLEEDILDGTLAAEHKAVLVTGVEYLDPQVVAALADFAAAGGAVLVTDECTVTIPGAAKVGFAVKNYDETVVKPALAKITDEKEKKAESARLVSFLTRMKNAEPLAAALKDCLAKHKLAPAFGCDSRWIAAGRQIRGEIEYLFAVNFAMAGQDAGGLGLPGPTQATLVLADDGRSVYDALKGQPAAFAKGGAGLSAKVDFAGGDMKAYARTARPIGGVLVSAPVFSRDLTRTAEPVRMELAATLVDSGNKVLSGTAPLEITVKDPSGAVRYDLFRATDHGVCELSLPLAANDRAGAWTVTVTDLLAGTAGQAAFTYAPLTRCGALAGATRRAVFFDDDKANIYRFFRDQRNVTIVAGSGDYNAAAAERLAAALKPYNVTCTVVKAADVQARDLTAEEARTWCGTAAAGKLKPGRANSPKTVGFDLANPAIVLGTPADNPLIGLLQERKVLPYAVGPEMPGSGRGMLAWNLHTLGHDVQAVACIAYDAAGMAEAVGTLFELAVGIDPLTPLSLPANAVVETAK